MSTNRNLESSPFRHRKRVRLVPHLVVEVGPEAIQLRSASRVTNLKGPMVARVLPHVFPLLDGSLSAEQVMAQSAAKVGAPNARTVLDALADKGFLEQLDAPDEQLFAAGSVEHYETIARYFLATDRTGDRHRSLGAIRAAKVALFDSGPLACAIAEGLGHLGAGTITLCGDDATDRCRALRPTKADVSIIAAGRPKTRDEWRAQLDQASCAVAVTHRPALFDDGLDVLNEAALATGKPWLTVALLGRVVQIGPLVHPGSTACLACLRLQLQRNASFLYAAGLMDRLSAERDRAAQLGPVTDFVAGLVVSEIARAHAAGQPPLSVGQILTIDTSTVAIDRFKVLKVPRCPVCGPARDRPMMRIWG